MCASVEFDNIVMYDYIDISTDFQEMISSGTFW